MIQQDRKEKERSEAKNSVEEYIYEAREKLSNEYERYIQEDVCYISLLKLFNLLGIFFLISYIICLFSNRTRALS